MKVLKFGGASVKDAASVKNVANIIRRYPQDQMIVVISAMGKVTNMLEDLVRSYFHKDRQKQKHFKHIQHFHKVIMMELFSNPTHEVYEDVSSVFLRLKNKIMFPPGGNFDYEYDQIVSCGELISSCILYYFLRDSGIDSILLQAPDVVMTDENFREGRVYWPQTVRNIRQRLQRIGFVENGSVKIIVTQGFIGKAPDGSFTTLGREGSDYSAAIFAHAADAEELIIWKDVPGLLNADPKFFPDASLIDLISFRETIELSYYGASIIHPKTIQPLENKNIPLRVKSFLDPDAKGTLIKRIKGKELPPSSIILKENQMLISISSSDFSFIAEKNLQKIFSIFAELAIRVNLMQNSAISFSVVIDDPQYKKQLLLDELSAFFKVRYNENLRLVTIRHYTTELVASLTNDSEIMLEQKSRFTYQGLLRY
jgi:aspartate kinase